MKSAKNNNNSAYGCGCEHCDGTVCPKKVQREAFKHKKGFIILEDIVIGVCDACGARYYSADILHAVNDIANGTKPFERIEKIPVARISPS
jgi:YgiT-type zinc finger domain-containing protein